jgi:hypothetical protein
VPLSRLDTEGRRRAPDHPHIQHSNLGITSIYLQGIDNAEIIDAVHAPPRADDPRQRTAAALTSTRARHAFRAKGNDRVFADWSI